ncbi:sensor domain-containing diguanylate cyclase [Thalassolituus sp. LLYu03]|uniref:sensor domain-containing diguanylate cyclase n=1 Tax=Thalassolituus sp. LLYu03 TaxID=3421656 RepID=UPI003D27D92D
MPGRPLSQLKLSAYLLPLLLALWALGVMAGPLPGPADIRAQYLRSDQPLNFSQAVATSGWRDASGDRLNFGFDTAWYWVRIPLAQFPLSEIPGDWIAEAGYPLIDHLTLYLVRDGQIIDQLETGNNLPYRQRRISVPGFALAFSSDPAPDALYIQAHSESSVQFPMQILPAADYWQQRSAPVAADAAFHAVLLSMLAYNLLIYLISRDLLFLLYAGSIGSIALMMANLHGWTYAFFWPESPYFNDLMVLLSIALAEVLTAMFGMRFLRLAKLHPGMYRLYLVLVATAVGLGLLSLIASYSLMIRLLSGLAVVMTMTSFGLGLILWRETRSRDVFLFFVALSFLLAGLGVYALQHFGLIPVNMFTSHSAEVGHIIQVILLALSLADRHNRERMARIAAQDVIISMQREANVVLDNKVRERTTELEQANRRLQEESTTDALTQVRNRRCFDQRFFTLYQEAYRQQRPLALLLIDIDHFKQFNDTYGHQTGDTVLQKVAAMMQQVLRRPMDTVYRYGGEEFAVLLPMTDTEGAVTVAEQLRKRVSVTRIRHDDLELGVTVSVGLCATIPGNREDQHLLYEAADKALYRAKEQGRNRVCAQPMTAAPPHCDG